MVRVSTRRPPNENSFHSRVPTGNCQASAAEASIAVPAGRRIQRRLAAPSVHSGYCGLYGRLPLATVLLSQSAYRPVSRKEAGGADRAGWSVAGRAGPACGSGACDQTAKAG